MNSVLNPEYLGEFGPSGGRGINEAPALEAVQRCRVMFLHAMDWGLITLNGVETTSSSGFCSMRPC